MRVVVTGAAGQLGSVVARELVARGHDVRAIDRRDPAGWPGGEHRRSVEPLTADLTDPESVTGAVAGADRVVHLAALSNPAAGAAHAVFSNNTQATFCVLTAAAAAGVGRVVIASSGSAYGMAWARQPRSPDYLPLDEDHPLRPSDAYSLSKQVDEVSAAAVHRLTGLSIVALRFPFVRDLAGVRAQQLRVEAEPELGARLLWAYVVAEDLAAAIEAALTAGDIGFEIIGIAAADTLSRTPTAELVAVHHPAVPVRAPLTGYASTWDTGKAYRLLGWRAARSWRPS